RSGRCPTATWTWPGTWPGWITRMAPTRRAPMRRTNEGPLRRCLLAAAALAVLAAAPAAMAQSGGIIQQARATGETASEPPSASDVGAFPKIGFETIATLEYGGTTADSGPGRHADAKLWLDSTFLFQVNDTLS